MKILSVVMDIFKKKKKKVRWNGMVVEWNEEQ